MPESFPLSESKSALFVSVPFRFPPGFRVPGIISTLEQPFLLRFEREGKDAFFFVLLRGETGGRDAVAYLSERAQSL